VAIGTFDELKTAAANWLKRSDLASRIPEFVALAEAHLNRELELRTKEADVSLTGVASSRFIALPSGFIEADVLFIVRDTGREPLTRVAPPMVTYTDEGEPQFWAIDGSNVAFERPCDSAYDFTLRCLTTFALTDAAPTNDLLTNYPDAYLAAVLAEGFDYALEEKRATYWRNRRDAAVAAIQQKDAKNRRAPLRADPALVGRSSLGRGAFNIYNG
jgi:hypothetical protein